MSSILRGRRWSFPLFVLAMLLSVLGIAPTAQAADVLTNENQEFTINYDCLTGQTLVVDPGQFRVKLVDESGNTVGYDQIISAATWIRPLAQYSNEQMRSQVEWDPGTETSFTQETGVPLNSNKVLWISTAVQWTTEGAIPEYDTTTVTCAGQPTDTDDDGVPDDLDQCPALPAPGSSDGCPGSAVINITNIQGGRTADGDPGSVTLTVTNPDEPDGVAESYTVEVGSATQTTPSLADGETSAPLTFEPMPGAQLACATSSVSGKTACVEFTVPNDATPANAGVVAFTRTCKGLNWTVTNTGWKTSIFNVDITAPHQSSRKYVWTLAPGESRSGVSPSYWYGLRVGVVMFNEYNADVPNPNVGAAQWTQPAGCTPPMSGGDKLVEWGTVTRLKATPRVTISTKAYHARYGYQVKGKGIVWFATAHPGTRTFKVSGLKVPRHQKRVVRYWVEYTGADQGITFGKHAFTGWHAYKRP